MKSIIIAGAARSGKTTLTRKIHQTIGGSIFAGDMLVKAFDKTYPELGISHSIQDNDRTSKQLFPFLSYWLEFNDNNAYRRFILDIHHLYPSNIAALGMDKKYKVVFMGYPDIETDRKFSYIREFPNQMDWTSDMPDEKLRLIIEQQINWSQIAQKECLENNIPFFNVHDGEFTQIQEEIFDFLIKDN